MTSVWDISEPGHQPSFVYRSRWAVLRGMGFGQREPVLIGAARIVMPVAFNFAALDKAIAQLIPEPVPEDLGGTTDEARLARRVVFWAGALQRHYYVPVFGRGHVGQPQRREDGFSIHLVVPYFAQQATQAALVWLGQTVDTYLATSKFGGRSAEEAKRNWAVAMQAIQKYRPKGVNSFRFLRAASLLNVPAQQFLPGYLSFGVGAGMRWLQNGYTDRTGLLAAQFAGNRMLTAQMLRRAGLPAPTHLQARSAEEAVRAANKLSYPVVVKPADRQQGKGVATDLNSDAAVAAAYANAAKISKNILVEKHFSASGYRMNVLNGQLFGVTERVAGGVIGDGTHSIGELVELSKLDETRARRARERQHALLELDDEALQLLREKGLTPQSIPEDNAYVRLRRRPNSSAGGSQRRVNIETIHPDNLRLPVQATEALRLDLAGVDILFPDISRSWREAGALICEVNGQPQIGTRSSARLLTALLEGDGRIPVVVVVSPNTKIDWPAVSNALPSPDKVGLATSDGIWLGKERVSMPQSGAFDAALRLLNNPEAESALVILAPGEIRKFGLPVDLCDALVLEAPDNWPAEDREALEELFDIAGRNALRRVYTSPGAGLAGLRETEISAAPAQGSLEEICREFLSQKPRLARSDTRPNETGLPEALSKEGLGWLTKVR